MGWTNRARARAADTEDRRNEAPGAADLSKSLDVLDSALALRATVLLVTPEEF